jgi:hypothetical protein
MKMANMPENMHCNIVNDAITRDCYICQWQQYINDLTFWVLYNASKTLLMTLCTTILQLCLRRMHRIMGDGWLSSEFETVMHKDSFEIEMKYFLAKWWKREINETVEVIYRIDQL